MINNSPKKIYYWLDPIRAIAAILVLLVHVRSEMFETYANLSASSQNIFTQCFFFLCSQGLLAVSVFFILSGFLVGGINIQRCQQSKLSIKKYVLDRTFRIGIPLFGAILIIVLINCILEQHMPLSVIAGQFIGLQFFIGDAGGVFWTLSYEIWFYITLLAIFLIYSRNKHKFLGCILLTICGCIVTQLYFFCFFTIIAGIIAFRLKDYKLSRRQISLCILLAIISYIITFFSHSSSGIKLLNILPYQLNSYGWVVLVVMMAILISQVVNRPPQKEFSIKLAKKGEHLSSFSYSLYLIHYQFIRIWMHYGVKFNEINIETISIFIAFCLLCILGAYCFYYVFERNTKSIQTFFVNAITKKYRL